MIIIQDRPGLNCKSNLYILEMFRVATGEGNMSNSLVGDLFWGILFVEMHKFLGFCFYLENCTQSEIGGIFVYNSFINANKIK